MRRIGEEKGSAVKSMTDAIDDCVVGWSRQEVRMARAVAPSIPSRLLG